MENICRPIIFFNNFVPADRDNHDWNYCAFGSFDGIQVEDPIFVRNEESSSAEDSMLENVWKHQVNVVKKLQGTYAAQIIYAMCNSNKTNEENFWMQDNLPFTFFCRMQFRGNLAKLRENKRELEKRLQVKDKISSWIYLTYDNSDLLIVIKAISYADGAGIINAMHQDVNFSFDNNEICALKNSFTVFALKQEFIDKTENKEFRESLNQCVIDEVHITVIEKKSIDADLLKRYFKDKLGKELNCRHKPILGADDELFIFSQIGWGDFLYLYRSQYGILHNSSVDYHNYFSGITTKICTDVNTYYNNFPKLSTVLKGESKEEWRNLYKCFYKKMANKLSYIENKGASSHKKLYKELRMILNTLPKFSGEVFSDYIFFSVMKPLETIIELLNENVNKYGAYYEFIKSFNMYVQNSVKSDRHTMQLMDFNTKIYDIPVKLNAFYSVYIYRMCDILNISDDENSKDNLDNKVEQHTYDFLVVPGAANIVNVLELYGKVSDQRRLLRVEIPENRFYDQCTIMRIVSHEVAHYVGTVIRNRSFRYTNIISGFAYIYINYIRSYWEIIDKDNITKIQNIDWKFISDRMSSNINEMLYRERFVGFIEQYQLGKDANSAMQAKKIADYNCNNYEYLSFISKNINTAMSDIVYSGLENIFQSIIYELSEENKQNLLLRIEEVSERFLAKFSDESTRVTLDSVKDILCKIYEEGFADLTSICVLKLTAREYLNTIIKDCKLQGMDMSRFDNSEAIYRIAVVMNTMSIQQTDNSWTRDFYKQDSELEDRKKIINKIRILNNKIINDETFINREYEKSCFITLLNRTVYKGIVEYLCRCKSDIMQKVISGSGSAQYNELLKTYRFLSDPNKNIEDQIEMMEEFIHSYKSELYENEIKKYSGDVCYDQ